MQTQTAVATIVRRSLHVELAQRIRELISAGELAAATRIPEKNLCERFGVSRTPLREALKVLAVEGWITLRPQRGAWVAALTLADLEQATPVMLALECVIGQLACARLTDDLLIEFQTLHHTLRTAFAENDHQHYQVTNRHFHTRLLEITANPILQQTYASLAGRLRDARYSRPMDQMRWKESIADHEALMDALEQRDSAALADLLMNHLEHKLADLRALLAADNTRAERPLDAFKLV